MEDRSFPKEIEQAVQRLPKDSAYIPLYLNLLKTTDNVFIRADLALFLAQLCPENKLLKEILFELLSSPKTLHARGSLLYALSHLDISDAVSVQKISEQLFYGNYECMYKAYHMLLDTLPKMDAHTKEQLRKTVRMQGEMLGERLDMMEDLYDSLQETCETGTDTGS